MTQPNNIFNRMKLKFMAQQQKVKQCSHYSPGMMMLDVDELRDIEANWKEVLAEMEGYLMQELNDCNMMAAKMGMRMFFMMIHPMTRQGKRMRVEKSRSASTGGSLVAMPERESSEIEGLKYGKGFKLRWREKGGMMRRMVA